ncbi:MAG: BON domain-containing protein [Planctomycetes bacterium]|nr:BON domain-containing protein [Planctomycetota bacterium]
MFDVAPNEAVVNDDAILRLVQRALSDSHYEQFRNLQVYCEDGRVTVQGRLPTSFLKQVVQSVIQSVAGVREVDNDVTAPPD